ncbi:MAG: pseudouridine synthase [Gammaproteobacteria bacterium]|nr:pseudouridine synthase [Gammaproteobacteria bacterium]
MSEKIQKVLARAGLGSRRTMEEWIAHGRISVNGHQARLGDRIESNAYICVDGRPISQLSMMPSTHRVIAYHKPLGEVSSRKDEQGRPVVFDNIPRLTEGRWISIGRLDVNTSGLLLFTNDGEFANKLMHPSTQIEREYAVRIYGEVDRQMLTQMRKGVQLEDGMAHFDSIAYSGGEGTNHWYHVVLKEGRNRLVRRLWESQDVRVSRLIRIRYGNITLPRSLRTSRWVELEKTSIDALTKLFKK